MNRSENFFTDEEKKRIEETVKDVECCTIGEVAVMVVGSSSEYREASALGSMLLGSGISLLLSEIYFDASLHYFVVMSAALYPAMHLLFQYMPSVKVSFIGRQRLEKAVMERAFRAFYEKGLYKTKANTGVLFFLSLLERKVWVLADKGIYEKIDQQTLNRFANSISQGIKEKRACETLCSAIREAGELLKLHFPVEPGDTNELPDSILSD